MKHFFVPALIALAAAGFSAPGMAASDMDMHGDHAMMHMHAAPAAEKPLVDGVVKKIDKSSEKVTVSHGPLPNGMPAMTMAYRVKDAAWLNQMKAGDKIRFMPEEMNGAFTIVHFEQAK
jgi:Cu/Ag efflux protein CusF